MSIDDASHPLAGTTLVAEQLLPDVALTEAGSGNPWRPSQLRQRSALVLCFVHTDCDRCQRWLERVAARQDAIAASGGQVRAVLAEAGPSPVPAVLDAEGRARSRMLGPDGQVPTVLVADRYTAVLESYVAADHDLPDPDEIVATLRYVACDCS